MEETCNICENEHCNKYCDSCLYKSNWKEAGWRIEERLEAELAKHRWIPVSEGLPTLDDRHKGKLNDGTVDVLGRDGSIVFVANFFPKMQVWNSLEPIDWKPIILPD